MKPISEMTDQELVEAWFVEVHGWRWSDSFLRWSTPGVGWYPVVSRVAGVSVPKEDVPNILDSENAFNQWVNAYMEGRGWLLSIGSNEVHWFHAYDQRSPHIYIWHNRRRFRAAVEAALQIIREGE